MIPPYPAGDLGPRRALTPDEHEQTPVIDGCRVCGCSPSRHFKLRLNIGMLILRKWEGFDGELCRHHALQAAGYYLPRTLLLGWWGVISAWANLYAVPLDAAALVKALFTRRAEGAPKPGSEGLTFNEWLRLQQHRVVG